MAQISRRARASLFSRLQDRFNPTLNTICTRDSLTPFTIDFDNVPKSATFFWGQVDPDEIERSSPFKYPLMTVFTLNSVNLNASKPTTFDGQVTICVDVHLSWLGQHAAQPFEDLGDSVEETMVTIMNDLTQQNWGANVLYTGRIICNRSPITFGGKNWRQLLRFMLTWEVVA